MSKIARVRLSLKVLARTPGYLADLTDGLSRASGKTLTLEDTLDFLAFMASTGRISARSLNVTKDMMKKLDVDLGKEVI